MNIDHIISNPLSTLALVDLLVWNKDAKHEKYEKLEPKIGAK